MDSPVDYTDSYRRTVQLVQLDPEERKKLIELLHPELKAGILSVATIIIQELEAIFAKEKTPLPAGFQDQVLPIIASGITDGYFAFCIVRQIDVFDKKKKTQETSAQIGATWATSYTKDQHKQRLATIDPVCMGLLVSLYELRSNQLLMQFPKLVHLPYELVEQVNRLFRWGVVQGYLLGGIEEELAHE